MVGIQRQSLPLSNPRDVLVRATVQNLKRIDRKIFFTGIRTRTYSDFGKRRSPFFRADSCNTAGIREARVDLVDISHMTFARQQRPSPNLRIYRHSPGEFKCKMLPCTATDGGSKQDRHSGCPSRLFVLRLSIVTALPLPLSLGCPRRQRVILVRPSAEWSQGAISDPGSLGTGDTTPRPQPVGTSHTEHGTPPCSRS